MVKRNRSVHPVVLWLGRILLGLVCLVILLITIIAAAYMISNRTNGSLVSSGVQRRYLYYVPDNYNPQKPTPLVLSIHGFSSWPRNQMDITQWNTLADQYGFIVVYPSGTGFPKRWRLPQSSSNMPQTYDDVKFLSQLIDRMQQEYNIDPQRIYVNGLSNGGGMSVALGCELSDRIAAVGSVAGAYFYPLEACRPIRPVPMIAFHGTADPIVPFNGGSFQNLGASLPDVADWIKQRAELNGCASVPRVILDQDTVSSIEYFQCNENASVIFYTIYGGGHTWPGGNPLPSWIAGYTSSAVSATELMWKFYENHPLAGSKTQ